MTKEDRAAEDRARQELNNKAKQVHKDVAQVRKDKETERQSDRAADYRERGKKSKAHDTGEKKGGWKRKAW